LKNSHAQSAPAIPSDSGAGNGSRLTHDSTRELPPGRISLPVIAGFSQSCAGHDDFAATSSELGGSPKKSQLPEPRIGSDLKPTRSAGTTRRRARPKPAPHRRRRGNRPGHRPRRRTPFPRGGKGFAMPSSCQAQQKHAVCNRSSGPVNIKFSPPQPRPPFDDLFRVGATQPPAAGAGVR
jgi:hypothetical protein